jgi:site-specific DNA recombinase
MLGIYSRISVDRDNEKSIKEQGLLGLEFAKANNLEYKVYADKGISGGGDIGNRPAFSELIDDVEQGLVTSIYIWNNDRAAREEFTWFYLANLIIEKGVKLYENGKLIDLEDPSIYMMQGIQAVVNANFKRVTSKKIKTVLKRNREEGKSHAMLPFGYKSDENNYIIIDSEEVETIKKIFHLSNSGYGYARIATHLNNEGILTRYNKIGGMYTVDINRNREGAKKIEVVKDKAKAKWVSATIKNILCNTSYMGERFIQGQTYAIPPIIDKAIFASVRESILGRKKKAGKRSVNYFLLNDLTYCGKCRKRYTGRTVNRRKYYRCVSRNTAGASCGNGGIVTNDLERLIIEELFKKDLLTLVKANLLQADIESKLSELRTKIDVTLDKLKLLAEKRERVVNLVIDLVIKDEDAKKQIDEMEAIKIIAEKKINSLELSKAFYEDSLNKTSSVNLDVNRFERAPFEVQKSILENYIDVIKVKKVGRNGATTRDGAYNVIIDFKIPIDQAAYGIIKDSSGVLEFTLFS